MTVANLYGPALVKAFSGEINMTGLKVSLHSSSYVPNLDTHDYFNDVTNQVTGTGYTAGGASLGSAAVTYDTATNTFKLDANDVSWPSSTITARYAVVYKDTGTASTSPLICLVDFEGNVSSSSGTFSITWDAAGIVTATVA